MTGRPCDRPFHQARDRLDGFLVSVRLDVGVVARHPLAGVAQGRAADLKANGAFRRRLAALRRPSCSLITGHRRLPRAC